MYQTSDVFDKEIRGNSRTFHVKMKVDGKEFIPIIRNIEQNGSSNAGDYISTGGTVSTYITVTMENPSEVTIQDGTEITWYLGIESPNLVESGYLFDNTWKPIEEADGKPILFSNGDIESGKPYDTKYNIEFVPMGLFTAQKPQNNDGVLTFTAFDRMAIRLNNYYYSDLIYPIDAKEILREIEKKSGMPFYDIHTLPDGIMVDYLVQDGKKINPLDGYTYRESVGYLAQLYGMYATTTRFGEIDFRWYKDVSYALDADKYYDDLSQNDSDFVLDSISCTNGENTYTAGEGFAKIATANPLMTQSILDSVFAKIGGFTYLPSSLTFFGDPRLDIGDIITLTDKYGKDCKIPVMSLDFDFDGGLITGLASVGKTETEDTLGSAKGPTATAIDQNNADIETLKKLLSNKLDSSYMEDVAAEFDAVNKDISSINLQISDIKETIGEDESESTVIERVTALEASVKVLEQKIADIEDGEAIEGLAIRVAALERLIANMIEIV